ncbi:MAG: 30S ribosomal protein S17 [Candidatus Omnitrophica bacterium]|nr:30S ribosomal protein S17 [Candidatus Omnitrophota bacterium]
MQTEGRGKRKQRVGKIVSDAMQKTRMVQISTLTPHPRYKKVVTRFLKVAAHDEKNESRKGDLVRIIETRPLSKTKRWRVVEIVRQGEIAASVEQES